MPLPSKKFWNDTKVMLKHWEDEIRADERKKMNNNVVKPIIDFLPIVGMAAALASISSSKRRKRAVVKMVVITFKKQLDAARAEERVKIHDFLEAGFKNPKWFHSTEATPVIRMMSILATYA
jgi:hypothetical protein